MPIVKLDGKHFLWKKEEMFNCVPLDLLTWKQETKDLYTTIVNLRWQMFYDIL